MTTLVGAKRAPATDPRLAQPQAQLGAPLLCTKKAAQMLGLSNRTLEDWRYKGDGPVFRKLGGSVRYAVADLQAFLDAGAYSNTGQIAA